MELRILFKNTSYLLVTRIVKFSVGFLRAKLMAVLLGTLGTGIIAQLMQMTEALSSFTVLGMDDGLVKEIAEQDKGKEFTQKFAALLKSYIIMISIVFLLVISIAIFFSKDFTIYFLGDIKYRGYFFIGLAAFPIFVMNSISFAILKSFKLIKYIARSELIVLIINIIIFIPLIYVWGLIGAVVYITLAYLTILLINHFYARKLILQRMNLSFKDILAAKISTKSVKELFAFAGFGLTAGIALVVSNMTSRAIVVNKLGIDKIGIYNPVIIGTGLFVGFITPSIGTYLYPRFCESKSNVELAHIINDSLRFVTILVIPFILLVVPIRFQIIPLFYNQQFKIAGNYLPWHLMGALFYMWMYIFDQAMKPTGRIKTGGIIIIIMATLDLAVVYLLVPKIGLYGYMLKFIVSPILFFAFYMIYWKNEIRFSLEKSNFLIMGYALFSFAVLMTLEKTLNVDYKINFLIGLTLTGLSLLFFKKTEKAYIIDTIKNKINIKLLKKKK